MFVTFFRASMNRNWEADWCFLNLEVFVTFFRASKNRTCELNDAIKNKFYR